MSKEKIIENLVSKYSKKVYNLAFRITGSKEDAEDIAQETFMQAYRSWDKFRGDAHPYTWIYKIALNKSLQIKKYTHITEEKVEAIKNQVDANYKPPEEIKELQSDPEKEYIINEILNSIRDRCHFFMTYVLTDEQRIVYILRNVLDFSYKEISYLLDISVNVIKARLNRDKKALENHFKNNCYWYDKNNKCRCDSKIGYALAQDPELLNTLKKQINRGDYIKQAANLINLLGKDVDELYKNLPEMEFKTDGLKEYLISNAG